MIGDRKGGLPHRVGWIFRSVSFYLWLIVENGISSLVLTKTVPCKTENRTNVPFLFGITFPVHFSTNKVIFIEQGFPKLCYTKFVRKINNNIRKEETQVDPFQ